MSESTLQVVEVTQLKPDGYKDDKIAMLNQTQERILREKARQLRLVFHIDRALKYIRLKGSQKGISLMKATITEIFSRMQQAEMMMKLVQWKRMDSSKTPYDPLTNLEIEEAYCSGMPKYVFKHPQSADSFTIDFVKMKEINHTMNNQTCQVKRIAQGKC